MPIEFARDQYSKLKRSFAVDLPFGFAALREYRRGVKGTGDIDSGPVVFGMSTSGTGFAMVGAAIHGDLEYKHGLLRTAEIVGTSIQMGGERRYLFAPLIGDAIVLAMRTAQLWVIWDTAASARSETRIRHSSFGTRSLRLRPS